MQALLLLLPIFSFAADLRFTPYESLTNKQGFAPYRDAVHLLETSNGRCTATMVSAEGHLLTARHCVQHCLIRSGIMQLRKANDIDYFERDDKKLGKAICRLKVDGQDEDLVVESTSRGLISGLDEASFRSLNSALYEKFVADGYTNRGDFTLLRMLTPKTRACMPLNSIAPKAGEDVLSLGYPSETQRPDGFNSDGEQLYLTRGEILRGIKENACVMAMPAGDKRIAAAIRDYDHPGAFMSSLDAIHGSSGSAVVNAWGDVIGLMTNMYIHTSSEKEDGPIYRYCRGEAKALSIESLVKLAPELAKVKCER